MLTLLDKLRERFKAGTNGIVNSFFNFLDKLIPPKVESPFATRQEIQDFFGSSHGRRKKTLRTEISKDSLLKDQKNWADILSEQINTVEGTHFIIDPYNSHCFYPFKEETPIYYIFKQKATEHYTVLDLLKDRIAPLIGNIPIAIIRPQTGTILIVQFEDNRLYLLREQDRIRIFKHNSNTTRILGTLLKKYREQCSELV